MLKRRVSVKIDNTYYPLYHYHSLSLFISPKLLTINISNTFSLSISFIYHSYIIHISYLHFFVIPTFLNGFHPSIFTSSPPGRKTTVTDLQATPVTEPSRKRLCKARASWMGSTSWRPATTAMLLEDLPQKFVRDVWCLWSWCDFWCDFKRIRNDLSPKYLIYIYICTMKY